MYIQKCMLLLLKAFVEFRMVNFGWIWSPTGPLKIFLWSLVSGDQLIRPHFLASMLRWQCCNESMLASNALSLNIPITSSESLTLNKRGDVLILPAKTKPATFPFSVFLFCLFALLAVYLISDWEFWIMFFPWRNVFTRSTNVQFNGYFIFLLISKYNLSLKYQLTISLKICTYLLTFPFSIFKLNLAMYTWSICFGQFMLYFCILFSHEQFTKYCLCMVNVFF